MTHAIPGRAMRIVVSVCALLAAGLVYDGSTQASAQKPVAAPAVTASAGETPTAPGTYVPLTPARIMDTRSDLGARPATPGGIVKLHVLGQGGLPDSGVSAVVLNVTVVGPTAAGYLTVYPDQPKPPVVSNLNFSVNETVPNLVVVPVAANGDVDFYNGAHGTTGLLADVSGYYIAGNPATPGAFKPLTPTRIMDTRFNIGAGPAKSGAIIKLHVLGKGGLPVSGVSAIVVNVTVNAPTAAGYLRVFPDQPTLPTVSNLNFVKQETVPNLVIVPVAANGDVDFDNDAPGTTQLLADVSGYFLTGTPDTLGAFKPLTPTRIMDTRFNTGASPANPDSTVKLHVLGTGGLPNVGVSAVVLNVTVNAPIANGFLTVFPDQPTPPTVSNLNFLKQQTVPNLVIVPVEDDGDVDFTNTSLGVTQLLADVSGYYLGAAKPPMVNPVTGLTATPSSSTVTLSWVDPASGPDAGVTIRRAAGAVAPTSPAGGTAVTTISGAATTYTDTELTASTEYSYAVFVQDANTLVDYSTAADVTTTTTVTTPPAQPPVSGLLATAISSTSIGLTWTNPINSGFSGVKICRASTNTAQTSSCAPVGTVSATADPDNSFTDTGLTPASGYYYTLFAYSNTPTYSTPATAAASTQGGTLSVVAGRCRFTPPPAPATSECIDPYAVAVDANGNEYIADHSKDVVEKVTHAGVLSIVAGTGRFGAPTPGPATDSDLGEPQGVAVDSSGNLYIADSSKDVVEKVTPAGVLSVVAGVVGQGGAPTPGPATHSDLGEPQGVAVDASGNLYISDYGYFVVEKVTSAGVLSVVAGVVGQFGTPTPGPATHSDLGDQPDGMAVDLSGNLYIADGYNLVVEKVTPAGMLSVIAGLVGQSDAPTPGPATDSALGSPSGLAADSSGNLYITDNYHEMVEKVTPAGVLSIIAGTGYQASPTPGPATDSDLGDPHGVATDSSGNLYIADYFDGVVEKVTPAGVLSVVAGGVVSQPGAPAPGPATDSDLNSPSGVAVDSSGNLYIADTHNYVVEKVTSPGVLSVDAGEVGQFGTPTPGPATLSDLGDPSGVAVDSSGNLYIADYFNYAVERVTPAGVLSVVAGVVGQSGAPTLGPATDSALGRPSGVAVDASGNLYIADTGNNDVEEVTGP